ncbi:MAG: hypothetical protein QGH15_21310 [Kiritimatiellia bacterium]|nr:hypothetical protein [Kiritimatiellia bacterium]
MEVPEEQLRASKIGNGCEVGAGGKLESLSAGDRQRRLFKSVPAGLSKSEHFAMAKEMLEEVERGELGLGDGELQDAIENQMQFKSLKEYQAFRKGQLDRWEKRSKELSHQSGHELHVELLHEMMMQTGICKSDETPTIIKLLRAGLPMVGSHGVPELFPATNKQEPDMTPQQLRDRQEETRKRNLRKVSKAPQEEKEKIMESLKGEVEEGFLEELDTEWVERESKGGKVTFAFFPRFGVWQFCNETGKWKWRPIDDGKAALINRCAAVETPVRLCTMDQYSEVILEYMRKLKEVDPDAKVKSAKLDHRKAYRLFRTADGPDDVVRVVVACDPHTGEAKYYKANRLLFGEALSVLFYNAVSLTLSKVARRVLYIPACNYFDDFITPARSDDDQILPDLIRLWSGCLRTRFNEEKSDEGRMIIFLGIGIEAKDDGVDFFLSEKRKQKLRKLISGVQTSGSLPPSEASVLAGKLGFSSSALFGKCGRVFLRPLFRRAGQKEQRSDAKLSQELMRALRWWMDVLETGSFRRFIPLDTRATEHHIAYVDASMFRIGAILHSPGAEGGPRTEYFSQSTAEQSEGKEEQIGIAFFEALCVLQLLKKYGRELEGGTLILYEDNDNVGHSLVKGWSKRDILNPIIEAVWLAAARMGLRIRVERVDSDSNPADCPSRGRVPEVPAREVPAPELGGEIAEALRASY